MDAAWWLFAGLLGWLVGWVALRDVRWALVPGVLSAGLIALQPWDATFGHLYGAVDWLFVPVTLAMGVALLVWVPHLPEQQARITASLLGPLLTLHLLVLVGSIFLSMIG